MSTKRMIDAMKNAIETCRNDEEYKAAAFLERYLIDAQNAARDGVEVSISDVLVLIAFDAVAQKGVKK